MSRHIGFLVVAQRTGFMLEGKDHAAKIFDTQTIARRACKPLQDQAPVPIPYEHVARALLNGSAFCFDTEEGHARFVKALRNDPANKPFLAYSQDRAYIRWRHSNEKPVAQSKPDPGVAVDAPSQAAVACVPSVEASIFNPAILAGKGDPVGG